MKMKISYLDHINSPRELKKLEISQLPALAQELREFIIDVVSVKEGHLGASLGVVELTIALHYVFDTPNDLLIWDVGHQAYGHKILTGRKTESQAFQKYQRVSMMLSEPGILLQPSRLLWEWLLPQNSKANYTKITSLWSEMLR